MGQPGSKDTDADILVLRRGWWREHWRPMVVLAVLAAVVLAAWWPRRPATVELPVFETRATRPKPKAPAASAPVLEFNGMALNSVVQVINWRGGVQFVLADESLGDLAVKGSFRADDVEAFVGLLEREFGVRAERRGTGVVVLRK